MQLDSCIFAAFRQRMKLLYLTVRQLKNHQTIEKYIDNMKLTGLPTPLALSNVPQRETFFI